MNFVLHFEHFRFLVVIDQLPARRFNAVHGRLGRSGFQPSAEKVCPVIRGDLVQSLHEVLESISFQLWPLIRPAVKEMAEILQGFTTLGEVAYGGIHLQPKGHLLRNSPSCVANSSIHQEKNRESALHPPYPARDARCGPVGLAPAWQQPSPGARDTAWALRAPSAWPADCPGNP